MTSRRDFICGTIGLALASASGCATAPSIRAEADGSVLRVDLAQWPEGARVVIARRSDRKSPVIVMRSGDEFRALWSVCPHQGCIVRPEQESLVCPCHGSVFSMKGEVRRGPADANLTRLETSVEGTELLIQTPRGPG